LWINFITGLFAALMILTALRAENKKPEHKNSNKLDFQFRFFVYS